MSKERHVFPGGNTSQGFYSFYHYILPQEEANKIIILKGGPGTGKSSLMKKIASYYLTKGYSVEYHHCSSDNNSIDGVIVTELKVAILDGTAPHVNDPLTPGAIDEIINLGDCWNQSGLEADKNDILSTFSTISKHFKRAYRYFASAKAIHEDWSQLNSETIDLNLLDNISSKLNFLLPLTSDKHSRGKERHLFATAFTPNGIVTYIDNLIKDYKKVKVLKGGPGLHKTDILQTLKESAIKLGLDVEVFHDPFIPSRLEHILIPELSIAILTSNEINKKDFNYDVLNLEIICDQTLLQNNTTEIIYDEIKFNELVNKGLDCIKNAKALHDKLETYYVQNMDFSKVDNIFNEIVNKFDKYRP